MTDADLSALVAELRDRLEIADQMAQTIEELDCGHGTDCDLHHCPVATWAGKKCQCGLARCYAAQEAYARARSEKQKEAAP